MGLAGREKKQEEKSRKREERRMREEGREREGHAWSKKPGEPQSADTEEQWK